jgi:uncharacterized membrane protein YdjX (TVP38/TMEM64 family)
MASRPSGSESRSLPIALSLLPALVLALGLGIFVVSNPGFRAEAVLAWDLLWEGEPEALQVWLLGFGAWAPIISGLLQFVTSIFPPGPSFILGIVNAMLYGALLGGLLTFVTALLAAAACFGIARVVGRPGIVRLVSEERLARVDDFMERRGVLAVFLGRLVPFFNPDLVSYAAGVTGIRWFPFLVAVAAGALPSTIFYSIVGAAAIETTGWVIGLVAVATIVPLVLLALFGQRIWKGRPRGEDG